MASNFCLVTLTKNNAADGNEAESGKIIEARKIVRN